tara:strand:+ start:632 stop:772 length:141 start_codon:yes stop_codon:yes gene_type:complete
MLEKNEGDEEMTSEWYLIAPENNCPCKNCVEELGDCLHYGGELDEN